jgi:hypothetical protein
MKIITGYVLEARHSSTIDSLSYDDMKEIGEIRIVNEDVPAKGDDLNDTPYISNGTIYNGEIISLNKGDFIIIIKNER